jgi:uncharacterized protein YbjT (DUF2867 family)
MKTLGKKAVVVGAPGAISRHIVDKLLAEDHWQVVGLSRRPAKAEPRYGHIAVDLLDPKDVACKLKGFGDVTHIFYAGFSRAAVPPPTVLPISRPTAACW